VLLSGLVNRPGRRRRGERDLPTRRTEASELAGTIGA
jgi:hypothetical protein